MARPAHKNPSADTARRRTNRAKWRETRRFTGFSFEVGMYDRAKSAWQDDRQRSSGASCRATFTDWVAGALIMFVQRSADERMPFVVDYMNAENARRSAASTIAATVPDGIAAPAPSPAVDAAGAPHFDFNSLSELSNVDEVTP